MECEHYMSERYHSGAPRQEATGSIFVLAYEFLRWQANFRIRWSDSASAGNNPETTALVTMYRHFNEMRRLSVPGASDLQSSPGCWYTHLESFPGLPRCCECGRDTRAYRTACPGK